MPRRRPASALTNRYLVRATAVPPAMAVRPAAREADDVGTGVSAHLEMDQVWAARGGRDLGDTGDDSDGDRGRVSGLVGDPRGRRQVGSESLPPRIGVEVGRVGGHCLLRSHRSGLRRDVVPGGKGSGAGGSHVGVVTPVVLGGAVSGMWGMRSRLATTSSSGRLPISDLGELACRRRLVRSIPPTTSATAGAMSWPPAADRRGHPPPKGWLCRAARMFAHLLAEDHPGGSDLVGGELPVPEPPVDGGLTHARAA